MLIETIRKEMQMALKNNEHDKKIVLSNILGALVNAEKANKNKSLNEIQEGEIVTKLMKQVKETLETCPSNRQDIIDKCNFEISIISQYMPKQLTEDEIKEIITFVLTDMGILETATIKNKGMIMKNLMPLVKGKADGKLVNSILETYYL